MPQHVTLHLGHTLADTEEGTSGSEPQGSQAPGPYRALPALPAVAQCVHWQLESLPCCPQGLQASHPHHRGHHLVLQHLAGRANGQQLSDHQGSPFSCSTQRGFSLRKGLYFANHGKQTGQGTEQENPTLPEGRTAQPSRMEGQSPPILHVSPPSSEKFSAWTGIAPVLTRRDSLPPTTEDGAPAKGQKCGHCALPTGLQMPAQSSCGAAPSYRGRWPPQHSPGHKPHSKGQQSLA